ncbi:MAG TPA: CheR family methyltransferase [Bacteroidales bacterium]|nr:CheR family methyltransferase [Bacteroidales bacterium]
MAFTFFFRDDQILTQAVQKLVPMVMGRTNIHILNAGCAMGMETYTFAIILAEHMGKFALRNVKIHAIDIDNENVDFGKTVTEAVYHKDHLERLPEGFLEKYFTPIGDNVHYRVIEHLRALVNFQKYDLLSLKPLRSDYSMIICKNVLLHFNYEQRLDVLSMYHDMLLPGGLLVMENTQSMPEELKGKYRKMLDYAQLHEKI